MAVAAGIKHSLVVSEQGHLFTFGNGGNGELGLGDNTETHTPVRVAGLPPVRQVAAGHRHTGIVTEAGELLMAGAGWDGQLGLGEKLQMTTPTLVTRSLFGGEAVLMVACGWAHTVVATKGGSVYTFGNGIFGRLGHGDANEQLSPQRVPAAGFNGERIVMVAAVGLHTVALSEKGHVFTWGGGGHGQLGHDRKWRELAPRQVEPGWFGSTQDDVPERVVYVAAGGHHTAAVTAGGQLYTWGENGAGQLGHGDLDDRLVPTVVEGFGASKGGEVVMVACGAKHTLVVTRNGALWACGRGVFGELGLNDEADRNVFERVTGDKNAAFGGEMVVAVAAGSTHSQAVTKDGALWTWGDGDKGRLGHGTNQKLLLPTRVTIPPLEHTRVGRLLPLAPEHALAFGLSLHQREIPPEIIKMMIETISSTCGLDRVRHRAVITLIGGFWMI